MGAEKTCYTFHHVRGQEDAVDTKRDSDGPLKKAAATVSAGKVVFGLILALIAAIVSATVYIQSFATTEAVASSMDRHEASDGHPSLSSGIRGISDRLLRVEITQGAMVETQKSMDSKLDRILSVIPLVRLPTYQPPAPTQPDP